MQQTETNTPGQAVSPADLNAWITLGRELGIAPETVVVGIDPTQTSTRIAEQLVELLGERKAMWVRTRLCQIVEAKRGRRTRGRGQDKVATP